MTFGGGLLNSFLIILVGRGIEGLGAAFFIPASTALLLDVFTQQERGMAQGQMMMISMFITAFAPTVAGLIIQAISWPYAYLMTIVSAATPSTTSTRTSMPHHPLLHIIEPPSPHIPFIIIISLHVQRDPRPFSGGPESVRRSSG